MENLPSIRTRWSISLAPYEDYNIELDTTEVSFVKWFDPSKNPSRDNVSIDDFETSYVAQLVKDYFTEEVYQEVLENIKLLKVQIKD